MHALTVAVGAACLIACAGAARGSPGEPTLPGVRPGTLDRYQLLVAAAAEHAPRASATEASPRSQCEEDLRLPWGPIQSCRTAIVAGGIATSAAVSMVAWWAQGFTSNFNIADEAWFDKGAYAGGVDKLGTRSRSTWRPASAPARCRGRGCPQHEAKRVAAGVTFGFGLGVEILDGLSRNGRAGFSWEDMVMNALGVGLGVAMETHPQLDRHLAFRWMYSPGGRDGSWYDHHVYLLAWRLSGLSAIGPDNPLRYLELVAGYGAKGFRTDLDYSQGDLRRRTAYFGIALNLTELLDRTAFAGSARDSSARYWTAETLRYVQPPGTVGSLAQGLAALRAVLAQLASAASALPIRMRWMSLVPS